MTMLLTNSELAKLNEIQRLIDEAYDDYINRDPDLYHKSSEGHISVSFGNYFERSDEESPRVTPEVEIYSYVLGPHRSHYFDSIDQALDTVLIWHHSSSTPCTATMTTTRTSSTRSLTRTWRSRTTGTASVRPRCGRWKSSTETRRSSASRWESFEEQVSDRLIGGGRVHSERGPFCCNAERYRRRNRHCYRVSAVVRRRRDYRRGDGGSLGPVGISKTIGSTWRSGSTTTKERTENGIEEPLGNR